MYSDIIKQAEESLVTKRNKLQELTPGMDAAIFALTKPQAVFFVKLTMEYSLFICTKIVDDVKGFNLTFIEACYKHNK